MGQEDIVLPDFEAAQFAGTDLPECDAIMKGGITSGIVYPYAILQIATKYRFRSLGGTSVGAIAAAFAAAAEYGRANGRPEAFLTLKTYSDALPALMPSLFQPAPGMKQIFEDAKAVMAHRSAWPLARGAALRALAWAVLPLAAIALMVAASGKPAAGAIAAALLAAIVAFLVALWFDLKRRYLKPLSALAGEDFGLCPGVQQPGFDGPGLTEWMHEAIQEIAFGDPKRSPPLTFDDLAGFKIDLKMVTTNLSMRRPHTLPKLHAIAGFLPERWSDFFPKPVMAHLLKFCPPWPYSEKVPALTFPDEKMLPVVVAARMSLSFPVLFRAVPLVMPDIRRSEVIAKLSRRKAELMISTVHFSDGGISSNFPIHMFDSLLPSRPTFALSLEDLLSGDGALENRVLLPTRAADGIGVQIVPIDGIAGFLWQIVSSAKDWQDQLLSEISGQRERIAKIYLTSDEGGLNLDMKPALSQRLMARGYQAGLKFTEGEFDFDENRWRRFLVVYRNLRFVFGYAEDEWAEAFKAWYQDYAPRATSYKEFSPAEKQRMADDLDALLTCAEAFRNPVPIPDRKFPQRSGALKNVPTY